MSGRSSDKREKSRLNALLQRAGGNVWKYRKGLTHKWHGVWPVETRWMVALRRVDRSGDAEWLIKLLRSNTEMPPGLEMSRLARDLLAELLDQRWSGHPLVRHRSMKKLFEPKSADAFQAAAAMVHQLQYDGLDGAFEFDTPQMSEEDAVRKTVKRLGKKPVKHRGRKRRGVTEESLTEYLHNRMAFDDRRKKPK